MLCSYFILVVKLELPKEGSNYWEISWKLITPNCQSTCVCVFLCAEEFMWDVKAFAAPILVNFMKENRLIIFILRFL